MGGLKLAPIFLIHLSYALEISCFTNQTFQESDPNLNSTESKIFSREGLWENIVSNLRQNLAGSCENFCTNGTNLRFLNFNEREMLVTFSGEVQNETGNLSDLEQKYQYNLSTDSLSLRGLFEKKSNEEFEIIQVKTYCISK